MPFSAGIGSYSSCWCSSLKEVLWSLLSAGICHRVVSYCTTWPLYTRGSNPQRPVKYTLSRSTNSPLPVAPLLLHYCAIHPDLHHCCLGYYVTVTGYLLFLSLLIGWLFVYSAICLLSLRLFSYHVFKIALICSVRYRCVL